MGNGNRAANNGRDRGTPDRVNEATSAGPEATSAGPEATSAGPEATSAGAEATGAGAEAARVLEPGGALSRVLPAFESRPQQVKMAEAVARVLTDGGIGLIEAGTGTGKSLAYLTPSVLHATGKRTRVIVSTHTHNLQEQLLRHDIPLLQSALSGPDSSKGTPFEAAVLKGWTNYVCLWRLGQATIGQQQLFPEQKRALERLQDWSETGDHGGTLEETDFNVPDDVWSEVHAESDTCVRQRCQFYDDCYYFKARKQAQAADVVIANHHLLCADFAVRHHVGWDADIGVLPRANHIVFDEAHHLEDIFTQHFGLSFSRLRVQRLLLRVQGKTGLVPRLQHLLARYPDGDGAQQLATTIAGALPKSLAAVQGDSDTFFAHIAAIAGGGPNVHTAPDAAPGPQLPSAPDDGSERRRNRRPAGNGASVPLLRGMIESQFWQPLGASLEHVQTLLVRLAQDVRNWQQEVAEIDALAWETDALARRAESAAADLASLAELDDGKLVYWLEPHGRRREWTIKGAPIEIGPVVQETVLENVGSAIMTSATLSAGDQFQYLKRRLGLDGWAGIAVEERIESPFDYERQVLLCVADGMPLPDQPSFWPALAGALKLWLTASGGRAFVLFTSYRALNTVYDELRPWLVQQDMTPLRQNDIGRAKLLQRFRTTRRPVLFGTDSFWEGVDVPGDALSLVVVTRLPFRVPTDPVAVARRRVLQERGLDPFEHLTVPQAVMRLRQGFGRLIRHAGDRGAVIIADNRIVTRSYGRRFLAALPKTARHRGDAHSIAAALTDWI